MKKKFYFELLFLFILGALTSLSLPPYNLLFVNFITFSLFFIYIFKKKKYFSKNKAFLFGWFFGFGYFVTNLYWISISLTFDVNFKFLIPIALILIPAFLAIFYGVATYFFFFIDIKKTVSNLLLFSLIFGVVEFIRGNILTGFPWNLIAYSFSNNLEIIQITSLIGTYGFNILCISFFTSPAILILKENKKEIFVCIFILLIPIVLYVAGLSKIKSFQSLKVIKNEQTIRAVGSKISLDRFYENTDTISVISELIELSEPDLENKTLFLWPEGIIPSINQSELSEFYFLFDKKFNDKHLLGIGINSFENKFYNSFSFYDHNLNLINAYNKVNLVPFGEFLPFEKILGIVGLKSLTNNYQSFSSGENRKIIKISENDFNIKILPLICYEIIYSGKIKRKDQLPDLIINISEDAWFGDSIGPHQHFSKSIFRAIESDSFVLRSANKGISAIVNNKGQIIKSLKNNETGNIEYRLPILEKKGGNRNDLIFFVLLFTYCLIFLRYKKND